MWYFISRLADQLFSNQFVSVANTTTFSTSGVGTVGVTSTASFTLKYTDSLVDIVPDPTQPLFYNVERGGFISTADSTVIDYNQITFEDSKYDGSYNVIGVGTTSFVISLSFFSSEILFFDKSNPLTLYFLESSTNNGSPT